MRAIDKNPYFSEGIINRFLNKVFPFRFWGNLLMSFLFAAIIMQAPIYIVNYLELKHYGIEAIGKMRAMSDYSGMAQSLFAIPIFIAVRELVAASFKTILDKFDNSVVEKDSLAILKKRNDKLIRFVTSKWIEIALIVISFAIPISTYISEFNGSMESWYLLGVGSSRMMTISGIYAWFFTIPLFMFLTLYWARQIFVWGIVLFTFSRSSIKYNALVPDGYCGIGFLQDSIRSFSLLIFAQGIIQIATILYKINEQGLPLYSFNVIILVISYIVLAPTLFIIPMTFFTKKIKTEKDRKTEEIIEEARLTMESDLNKAEKAAAYNEYVTTLENINRIKIMPVDFKSIARLFVSAIVPMLPVITRFAGLDIPGWIVDLLGNV